MAVPQSLVKLHMPLACVQFIYAITCAEIHQIKQYLSYLYVPETVKEAKHHGISVKRTGKQILNNDVNVIEHFQTNVYATNNFCSLSWSIQHGLIIYDMQMLHLCLPILSVQSPLIEREAFYSPATVFTGA